MNKIDWKRADTFEPPKDRQFLIAIRYHSEILYEICIWSENTWPSGKPGFVSGFDNIGNCIIEDGFEWWAEITPPQEDKT